MVLLLVLVALIVLAALRKPRELKIICPNPRCGYVGPPLRVARGSTLAGLVLLLFFVLPGVLYFMFKSGYRYNCPQCGLQISVDN